MKRERDERCDRLLDQLVLDFFKAERLHQEGPCLHRYRGAVRVREVARRSKRYREARHALELAAREGIE